MSTVVEPSVFNILPADRDGPTDLVVKSRGVDVVNNAHSYTAVQRRTATASAHVT